MHWQDGVAQRWPRGIALKLNWRLVLTKGFTWRRNACCFAVRRAGAAECAGSNSSVDAASAAIAAASSCHRYWLPHSTICVCASASAPFAGPVKSCRLAIMSRRRPGRRPDHVRARVSPVTSSPTLSFLKIRMQRLANKDFSEILSFKKSSLM